MQAVYLLQATELGMLLERSRHEAASRTAEASAMSAQLAEAMRSRAACEQRAVQAEAKAAEGERGQAALSESYRALQGQISAFDARIKVLSNVAAEHASSPLMSSRRRSTT